MSAAATARASAPSSRTAPQAAPRRTAPPLRVVSSRRAPARTPFVLLVAALLAIGLVAVLLINTWLAQGSFAMRTLQQQKTAVELQAQAVSAQIAANSAPDALASRAAALGMVPAPNPVFKAADGHVLGVPNRAVRPAPPPPPPTPTPIATATPTPTATISPTSTAKPGPSPTAGPTSRAAAKPSISAKTMSPVTPKVSTSKAAAPGPGGGE